eukprot:gene15032-16583_t
MALGTGGGHKINILKNALKEYKDDKNTVVMFTDSYDVIFTTGPNEILKKFLEADANLVFSAEDFCWPDKTLASDYPDVKDGYKYLCSGGIIGYASTFNRIVNFEKVGNTDDDQLYYTRIYLKHRDQFKIKLDHKAQIVQNLNGNLDDIELTFKGGDVRVSNTRFDAKPAVIHGNGPSKLFLNTLGNYLAKSWTFDDGCMSCTEDTFSLKDTKVEDYPKVLVGLFIEKPTPFVPSYLERVAQLDYPKNKIDVFIHNGDSYHSKDVNSWLKKYKNQYNSVKYYGADAFLKEYEARNKALTHCKKVGCDYVFTVDADVTVTHTGTLRALIEQNRTVIAPMVARYEKLWSNFWGAIGDDGFYARSDDYIDIVKYNRMGVWNVPFISKIHLMKASVINDLKPNAFHSEYFDADMVFSSNLRNDGVFMYVTNMEYFGHLKDGDNYQTTHKHNDMYELLNNQLVCGANVVDNVMFMARIGERRVGERSVSGERSVGRERSVGEDKGRKGEKIVDQERNEKIMKYEARLDEGEGEGYEGKNEDWEDRYLNENYSSFLNPKTEIPQPCPDVFWFPLMSLNWTKELVEEMEHFGKWSSGGNKDDRLAGGYENVPTVDIHMNQIGFEKEWLRILKLYVAPMATRFYEGYYSDSRAIMNFVVKYTPTGQNLLRPHHDSSTFTINVALNRPFIDYEGGGTRFIRYNCTAPPGRVGWGLMSPGRLTHYHEGLVLTKGVRYIMVSFIDP